MKAQWKQAEPDMTKARKIRVYNRVTQELRLIKKGDPMKNEEEIYDVSKHWLKKNKSNSHREPYKREVVDGYETPPDFWEISW